MRRKQRRARVVWTGALFIAIAGAACSEETTGELSPPPRESAAGDAIGSGGSSAASGSARPAGSAAHSDDRADPGKPRVPPGDAAERPGDDRQRASTVVVPEVAAPALIGTLIGPGAPEPPENLQLYGTDLGITFEHQGQLNMMFGDTWPDAEYICRESPPQNDDTLAQLDAEPGGGVPRLTFATDPAEPARALPIQLLRGDRSLTLGFGQVPMAGFSDGEHAYAFFARLAPAHCDAPAGEPECPTDQGFSCSDRIGECEPAYTNMVLSCDLEQGLGCWPGQRCVARAPACVDRDSSQYDGSIDGETSSVAEQTELAIQGDEPERFSSILVWPTNKFANLTARTVARFTDSTRGNDYGPGHDRLLVWGRAGFVAEHGREAQLYLMTHRLPLVLDERRQLKFEPSYFAGLDPETGEPVWSDRQGDARALALDGVPGGDPHEEVQFAGQMAISWLGAPIDKWVMLYGGDITDFLLVDSAAARSRRAPGAIMMRFADQPWGPWSPPVPHLAPGNPHTPGDWYGPGGHLYHPDCVASGELACTKSDPRRPPDSAVPGCPVSTADIDPGRLYGVNVIDPYTAANADGGLDLFWNVSLWNPYAVALLKTSIAKPSSVVSPGELADAAGLLRMTEWRTLPTLEPHRRYRQQTSRDRGTGDTSFPLSGFGNRDFNNFLCASADAELSPNQIAPFHFDLERCDEDYVRGAVIGRFEGSGRLVRTWIGMASLLLGPADEEVLRVYVDDDPMPRVEVPLAAALDGSAGEIFAPPFGAGSPRRMAWYYPIAFEHKLIVALDRLGDFDEYYYHCDVIHDDAMRGDLEIASTAERRHAQSRLSSVYHPAGTLRGTAPALRGGASLPLLGAREPFALEPGERRAIVREGPATIHELELRVVEADLIALADVRVRARWDDASRDAIDDLPLLELFAAGQTAPEGSTPALTSFTEAGERVLVLKLPMPFATSAQFVFENRGTAPIAFELSLRGEATLPVEPFGRLHVRRSEALPSESADHVSLDLRGAGRLVGVCGFLEGTPDPAGGIQYDPLNLLEGDVRVLADGELALDGTGTEEYADDVFYFTDAPHTSPFVQAWGLVDDVRRSLVGEANFCRWHVLGTEIDFQQSLEVRFELGGAGNPEVVSRHHTVAYVYLAD